MANTSQHRCAGCMVGANHVDTKEIFLSLKSRCVNMQFFENAPYKSRETVALVNKRCHANRIQRKERQKDKL